MAPDERAQDLLDELREGRGKQSQINNELYRRVSEGEVECKTIRDAVLAVDKKVDGVVAKVVSRVSGLIGLALAIIALFQFVIK